MRSDIGDERLETVDEIRLPLWGEWTTPPLGAMVVVEAVSLGGYRRRAERRNKSLPAWDVPYTRILHTPHRTHTHFFYFFLTHLFSSLTTTATTISRLCINHAYTCTSPAVSRLP